MSNRPIVANLDFQDIKQDIIDFYKSKPEFKDYEFTGSALNLLVDMLAYNTHYNSLAANFLVNEMFLDSANMRSSVASIAKQLNYTPRSSRAAKSSITLRVPKKDREQYYIIPAGSLFEAKSGGSSLKFYTLRDYSVQYDTADSFKEIIVQASEGKIYSQRFMCDDVSRGFVKFPLDIDRLDTESLVVSVNGTRWTQITPETEGITSSDSTSQIFFIEENIDNRYTITFGNNVIGKGLNVGDEVVVTYLVTNEESGNGVKTFTQSISGRPDITIVSATTAAGGSEAETVYEIKNNAPHWFEAQYRAVTTNDYEVILKKKFGDIQSVKVYGGEDVGKPGNVYIAIKPRSSDVLEQATKTAIANEILSSSNVVTIRPQIIDPYYVDVIVKTVVTYDDNLLATSSQTLKAKVLTLFNLFNSSYLGQFEKNFHESRLTKEILAVDDAVVSVNSRINLAVTQTAAGGILENNSFSFENRLYHPEEGHKAVFNSSLFYLASSETQQYGFSDDGRGNIRLYEWTDGAKNFIENNIGKIDYKTGNIDIDSKLKFANGSITFTVIPDSFDVIAINNTITRIDTARSLVEVIDQTETALLKQINVSRSE